MGRQDWTGLLIPAGRRVRAAVRVRESAILCGRDWFCSCLSTLDPTARIDWKYGEGATMSADTDVCHIEANARALLSAERPALNFLQLLSGTATVTRRHVEAIEGAATSPRGCAVLDTRKTLPGLRQAQKYAVRVGGGQNQRLALWHGILIKENHIAAAGSLTEAIRAARRAAGSKKVEVEVETLQEFSEALQAAPDIIMLDEFSLSDMRAAVELNSASDHSVKIEASGRVTLETVRAIAETGVDYISIGSITKHVRAVDLSMRLEFVAR
jgi:nicotinate-nucleotide pyrophosphorylase (carboxylating)